MGRRWGISYGFGAGVDDDRLHAGRQREVGVRVEDVAEIFDDEVRVGAGGDPHVAVTHEPLHAVDVDAGAEQGGREGVAEIVEAHRQMQRHGPELSPARVRHQVAAAIGGLEALRTEARLGIVCRLDVLAPAASVLVALDDAGAGQRVAQNLLRVRFARPLRTVRRGEHQRARRVLELVLQPGSQRGGDRQQRRVAALRGVALMRPGNGERPAHEVDVALAQREELALAQAQRGTAGEDRPPVGRDLLEHARELVGRERLVDALRHLAPLERGRGVLADPPAGLLGLGEDGVQLGAQVVQRRRRLALLGELVEHLVEVLRAHARERELADLAADDVQLEPGQRAAADARIRAAMQEPPLAQVAQGAGELVGADLQPAALQPCAPLQLRREFKRLSLPARRHHLAGALAVRVEVDRAPAVAVSLDLRHA